jgi:hypothetical protein
MTKPAPVPLVTAEALAVRVPELAKLLSTKHELERQIAVDQVRRGPKHPLVLEARQQLEATRVRSPT